MDYSKKYLKYKNKYLLMKYYNQNVTKNMKGGGLLEWLRKINPFSSSTPEEIEEEKKAAAETAPAAAAETAETAAETAVGTQETKFMHMMIKFMESIPYSTIVYTLKQMQK